MQDDIIMAIMKVVRTRGKAFLENKDRMKKGIKPPDKVEESQYPDMSGINNSASLMDMSGEPEIDNEDLEQRQNFENRTHPNNPYNFKDLNDLDNVKELLRQRDEEENFAGVAFNTNVLRIALNEREENIAKVLVTYYQVEIDKDMIIRAIKTRQIKDFLYCVWAFNKNYEYRPKEVEEVAGSDFDTEKKAPKQLKAPNEDYFTFTYDLLFKWILQYC